MRLNPVWILCLLLAACQQDPVNNPGTWKLPSKGLTSNDENLRAMVVNPQDLVAGTGDQTGEGVNAARAARRELTGHRAPLLNGNVSLSNGGSQQGQSGQQSGGGTGAGGASGESE